MKAAFLEWLFLFAFCIIVFLAHFKSKIEAMIIFYADDDKDDLDIFKEILFEIDKNKMVYTHTNGDDLVKAVKNAPPSPQIIFLDLNMPGKNGFETLEEIRRQKNMQELPVIILSTSEDERTVLKSKKLGANFYISKSGEYEKLKRSIDFVLKINWSAYDVNNSDFVFKNN